MIDWVSARLPCHHQPIPADKVIKVSPEGETRWETRCRHSVSGSYDSNITIRSGGGDGSGRATELVLSGNPSKFLQGHNVFGSDHLISLVEDTYLRVLHACGIMPNTSDVILVKQGAYNLSRIDINYSFSLPSRGDVRAWIRAAAAKSRSRHGTPTLKSGTLYWSGMSSTRWLAKVYSKGDEIESRKKGHKLPEELLATPIAAWADNKLRFEIILKRKELEEQGITQAKDLPEVRVSQVFNEYLRRIDMSEQVALSDEAALDLPSHLRSSYALWNAGIDVRQNVSQATFYRHRKQLLNYGIDILLLKDTSSAANVVPLIRVLEAKPADVPQWAFEENLVHQSASRTAHLA